MRTKPNQYVLPSDPNNPRVMQDLVDRINFLTGEVERMKEQQMNLIAPFATKASPAPGIISLPSLGAPGFIRVTPDGIVHSYSGPTNISSNGQIIGLPYVIHTNFTTVGNVGGGVDTLHTYTMPANTLAADGDFLEYEYSGQINNAGVNAKTFGNQVAGTTIENGAGGTFANGGLMGWRLFARVIRVSPVLLRCSTNSLVGFLSIDNAAALTVFGIGFGAFNRFVDLAVSNVTITPVVLNAIATGTSDNDIDQRASVIKLTRMS